MDLPIQVGRVLCCVLPIATEPISCMLADVLLCDFVGYLFLYTLSQNENEWSIDRLKIAEWVLLQCPGFPALTYLQSYTPSPRSIVFSTFRKLPTPGKRTR